MKFENVFDVQAPIDETYQTLLDIERVAPCLPGAQVLEKTGEAAYKVGIKVKVGPIQMTYRGEVEIVERDDAAHRAVLHARAREARGQGTAEATVEMRLEEREGATHATVNADVQLSGKAAAMGQGVIQDVSARLLDQFAANLQTMLAGPAEPVPAAPPAPGAAPGEPAPPPPPRAAAPQAEAEALSAIDLAAAVVAGRLKDPKALAGLLAVVAIIAYLLGRRSRG